jgi:hypothetical protein
MTSSVSANAALAAGAVTATGLPVRLALLT